MCELVSCHHSFFFFLNKPTCLGLVHIVPLVFIFGLAFFVPALLPGFKLCHDRVFCAHDLERLDRPHWQREPHCGGAEVSPSGCHCCRDPGAVAPCVKACMTAKTPCFNWINSQESSLLIGVLRLFHFFWLLLKNLLFQQTL